MRNMERNQLRIFVFTDIIAYMSYGVNFSNICQENI